MSLTEHAAGPNERTRQPASLLSDDAAEETLDLGEEIASAVLHVVRLVTEQRVAAFEIAEPEPVLRGVISAFAAISQTLPHGVTEAWAQLGLLAIELDDAGNRMSV